MTYDVIPIGQSVGLMEFVPDTDQLLTVISPGVIPAEDVDAARKAYSLCAAELARATCPAGGAVSCVRSEVDSQLVCVHRTGNGRSRQRDLLDGTPSQHHPVRPRAHASGPPLQVHQLEGRRRHQGRDDLQ